jgi:Bacterial regulatory proteins, luxR family
MLQRTTQKFHSSLGRSPRVLKRLLCGTVLIGVAFRFRGTFVKEAFFQLAPREQQIAELLLQGCENDEIGKRLNIARRTVKAHFNRLFVRFGITTGIKRVKLATLLYRRQLCLEASATENEFQAPGSIESLSSWPKGSKTVTLRMQSEPQNMSLKTISEPSTTNSASGTASNSRSGTRLADTKTCCTPEVLEKWERRILRLERGSIYHTDLN